MYPFTFLIFNMFSTSDCYTHRKVNHNNQNKTGTDDEAKPSNYEALLDDLLESQQDEIEGKAVKKASKEVADKKQEEVVAAGKANTDAAMGRVGGHGGDMTSPVARAKEEKKRKHSKVDADGGEVIDGPLGRNLFDEEEESKSSTPSKGKMAKAVAPLLEKAEGMQDLLSRQVNADAEARKEDLLYRDAMAAESKKNQLLYREELEHNKAKETSRKAEAQASQLLEEKRLESDKKNSDRLMSIMELFAKK
jgi:hypothetical protein